jgi:hypothetical protein
MSRPYRPLTGTKLKRAELLSRVHPCHVVAELVGSSTAALTRAKRRGWKEKSVGHPLRPMPTDFAIQSRHMTLTQMTRHYRASNRTVWRWSRELAGLA